jgi:hypothetical protein
MPTVSVVAAQTAIFIPKWESGRASAIMLGVGSGTTTYGLEIGGFAKRTLSLRLPRHPDHPDHFHTAIFHTMAIGQDGYIDYHGGGMEDCRFMGGGSAAASCVRRLYVTGPDGARGTLTDEITEALMPTPVGDVLLAIECVHLLILSYSLESLLRI